MIAVTSSELVRPLQLQGGGDGCLLVHGFTSSPADIRPLSRYLHSLGCTVREVLLPGHGVSPMAMAAYSGSDWLKAVEDELAELKNNCPRTWVLGFSMGGILALLTASRQPLAGLVTIGAPIWPRPRRTKWAFLFRRSNKYIGLGKPGEFRHPSWRYEKVALKNVADLMALIRQGKKALSQVAAPALVVQGGEDRTVKPASALYIFQGLGSRHKELLYTAGGHMLLLGDEGEQVCRRIGQFIEETRRDDDDRCKTSRGIRSICSC